MERRHLEHLIRAASSIVDEAELVIVGSQAVLGQFPDAPDSLKVSMEADMYPSNRPELADLIEGSIGEGSPFEQTFGYYAQGVSPNTAILPRGWEGRLTKIQNENTRYATGYCIDVHDLVLSKYVANRPKDIEFNREVIRHKMVELGVLVNRAELLPVGEDDQRRIVNNIRRDFGIVSVRDE